MTWRMPPETALHERTWMAFPRVNAALGDTDAEREEAYATWAAVAHAIQRFEPVVMVVDPTETARARRMLDPGVDVVPLPLDDYWMRDFGPTFVVDDDRPGVLGAIDWRFNAWGAQPGATWTHDARIASGVAAQVGAEIVSSLLVNEGGAIHVDGEGTVLVTETVQLDPGRNPYADRASVEVELRRLLGVSRIVWLPRGLTRDYEAFGTRGHVDMVATSPSPGRLLLHAQTDPAHPDHAVTRDLRAVLESQTDARGRPFDIVDVPAPRTLRDEHGFVDWTYLNHLVVNGGVIACAYGEADSDGAAAELLAAAYPGRTVVSVDARPILARGGGIHCITQQQPAG